MGSGTCRGVLCLRNLVLQEPSRDGFHAVPTCLEPPWFLTCFVGRSPGDICFGFPSSQKRSSSSLPSCLWVCVPRAFRLQMGFKKCQQSPESFSCFSQCCCLEAAVNHRAHPGLIAPSHKHSGAGSHPSQDPVLALPCQSHSTESPLEMFIFTHCQERPGTEIRPSSERAGTNLSLPCLIHPERLQKCQAEPWGYPGLGSSGRSGPGGLRAPHTEPAPPWCSQPIVAALGMCSGQ